MMKLFISISIFLLLSFCGYTQQLHFAYLQTDTHKPFYVSFNKKNYSSTASGYIILPKLQNGDYPLRIGFAKNEGAEQEFLLQVKDNDQGFLIKDFGDKGWGLFNLQTMAVQYAGTATAEKARLAEAEKREAELRQQKLQEEALAAEKQRRDDSLKTVAATQQQRADSIAAASAANTSLQNYNDSVNKANSITQQKNYNDSVAKATAILAENERLEKKADSLAKAQAAAIEKQKEAAKTVTKPDTNTQQIPKPDSVPAQVALPDTQAPVRLQQTFTDTGWHYAYRVTNKLQRETVDVFIPAATPKQPVTTTVPDVQKDTTPLVNQQSIKDTVKTIDSNLDTSNATTPQKVTTDTVQQNITPIIAANAGTNPNSIKDSIPAQYEKSILNSNCRAVAGEKDFLTARKKIAAAESTDAMIVVTRKLLKEKCYTTDQLRNLSVLFLTDADRYQFLDAAYPFAFDAYRYNRLQDLLKDDYYVQRFKAMLR